MNKINEVNYFCKQIDQESSNQNFFGLQYVLDDFSPENTKQSKENLTTDWYGLTDLTID